MELTEENLDLIRKLIRVDKKFKGNEDLFDDFFNETCRRTLPILETIDDNQLLEAYIRKIVSTAIVIVLKNMGRLRRSGQKFVSNNEFRFDFSASRSIDNKFGLKHVNYNFIKIPQTPEDITIEKEMLQKVYDSIVIAHSTNVSKDYLTLFDLRYVKCKKQKEIAKEMNISQSQVSKRLFELMNIVRTTLQ